MAREVEARLKLSAVDRTAKAFNSVQNKLAQVERKTSAFNRTQMATSRAINQAETSMLAYGRVMGAVAVGGGLASAVRTTADYESSLTGIQKKLGGTAEEVAKLGEAAKDLASSGELAVPLEEILSAFERGAAAGIPLEELRDFATLSAKASDAFEMSASDIGNAAAGFNKALGVPMKDMERLFDLVNGLADSGISDESDIVQFLDKAGAMSKTFGLSVNQTAALGAALTNLKVPAVQAGTAINSIMTKLMAPDSLSKKGFQAFKRLTGDTEAFAKKVSKDADGALVDIIMKLKSLDKATRTGIIADLFGQEHLDVMSQLVEGSDELMRNLSFAEGKDWFGSLDKSYKMKLDDFWSQWQVFKNQVGELTIDVGMTGLPALKDGLSDIQKTLKLHQTLWEAYEGGKVNILQAFGLGVTQDDADRLEAEKAKIAAYRNYGLSRLAAPDLPNIGDESANKNINPINHLPDRAFVPGWRPGAGGEETFEQSYVRQNQAYLNAARPMPLYSPGQSPRESEIASMDALARNGREIQDALDVSLGRGADEIGEGGNQAAEAIKGAAGYIAEAGGTAANAIREAASALKAATSSMWRPVGNVGAGNGQLATGNLGRTMPAAGTTGSGAERRAPGGQP